MTARTESDEKYILDLAAEVLGEPDFRWQHTFPTLMGDPGTDGKCRPLPVDGYFPRHRLVVEYWEKQHSAPVPIMDQGMSASGVSRGHQRRLYDQRRDAWTQAQGLRLVILDYRGFEANPSGRLQRNSARDRQVVAQALRAAGVLAEPGRQPFGAAEALRGGCFVCRLAKGDPALSSGLVVWRGAEALLCLHPFPVVYGNLLVASPAHYEQVTGDVTLHQYLAQQRIVHAAAEAVRLALKPERVCVMSAGAPQEAAHVHWDILPCAPGLLPEEAPLALRDRTRMGVVRFSEEEAAGLVEMIRSHLPAWMRG